jgi:TM2 domain-containing membrane protein YozV
LNLDQAVGTLVPGTRHKSAGLAFGLSLLVPGAGQFYCGKNGRGGITLGFWLLGLIACFAHLSTALVGQALIVMLVLWVFSFLDAYFTAIESNKGQDELIDVQNPRVAVTLNLLTAGFGYFYLGERTKGILLFVAMQAARLVFPSTGFVGTSIALALVIVQLLVAEDAYRIARRQVKEALGTEVVQSVENAPPASRLPVQVPVVLACVIPLGFVVLIVIGLVLGSTRSGKRPTVAALNSRAGQNGSNPQRMQNDTPVPVVDFPTAIQDVQRVHRKSEHRRDEIANLKRDVRFLNSALSAHKVDAADTMVAHYFRAEALAMINTENEREGEAIDLAGARTARADLDQILGAGAPLTYVPEVSKTNAEYLAGSVARDELHDEAAGYAYWQQCASNAHPGCLHHLAGAMITGEGGEKVDAQEALKLHTSVVDSGVKYHCAGVESAMSIAYINYFVGVRRAGDDELEWTKKTDGLLDKLEAGGSGRNVCNRAGIEVNEFLFQLGRGHRDDNILQDAISRIDDDAVTIKAVVQFISGAIDETGFESAMNASKNPGARCSAYFDAMWYAELRGESAMARRFHQQLVEIGTFHCGQHLVYANKFKF